jgi:FO synthase
MFGHVEADAPGAWARHLLALRALAAETGGISEFVPLPFVHMQAPVFLRGGARRGPTLRECVLAHAVARLALHPHVTNIQASWVKMGPGRAAALLAAGCNDMGGSLMNESITKAAGAGACRGRKGRRSARFLRACLGW